MRGLLAMRPTAPSNDRIERRLKVVHPIQPIEDCGCHDYTFIPTLPKARFPLINNLASQVLALEDDLRWLVGNDSAFDVHCRIVPVSSDWTSNHWFAFWWRS